MMAGTLQRRARANSGRALERSERIARGPWPAILDKIADFEPDGLRLSLEFYRESVMRRVIDDDGHVSLAMVDIAEVACALSAGVSLASGVLPGEETGTNTLFWSRSNGATRLGIWAGPRIWRIILRSPEPGGKDRRFRLPFPGLLLVCRPDASGAYVFAASKRPRSAQDSLYCCPAPNVFANGRICPGNHAFARDPLKLPSEFFLSKFRVTADTRGGKSRNSSGGCEPVVGRPGGPGDVSDGGPRPDADRPAGLRPRPVNVAETAQPVGIADAWPETAPNPYGYLVAHDAAPDPLGLIADVVLDGGGVYLAAATQNLSIRIRVASATVPGLPVVPMGVSLTHGRIPESLWRLIVETARAAMPREILLAIVAREPARGEVLVGAAGPYWLVEPQLDESGSGDWRPQQASGCAVRATPVHDAIVEIHSHHAMRAYFSATDDRDETGRRVYGVLGRLYGPHPEIALRVASGCNPLVVGPVPFSEVFAAELGEFRDLNLPAEPRGPSSSIDAAVRAAPDVRARARQWYEARLLFEIAEDVAAIRDLLESNLLRPDVLPDAGLPR